MPRHVTPALAEAADAACVWACGRPVDQTGQRWYLLARATLVGPYLITVAHNCASRREGPRVGSAAMNGAMMSPTGPFLFLSRDGLTLGAIPHMTVSLERPPAPTSNGKMKPAPDEQRVHPIFVEPFSDLAVLADHPAAPGATGMLRRDRKPLKVRRRPLVGMEPIYLRGSRGWARGFANAVSGPNAEAVIFDNVSEPGDCGGPVIDQAGELVGVHSLAPATKEPPGSPVVMRGPLAQLCRALPAWLLEVLP